MTHSLSQIREDSRQALAGNYMLFFLVLVITGLLTGTANQLLSYLAWPLGGAGFIGLIIIDLILDYLVMILAKMFQAGHCFLSLNIARYNRVSAADLFLAFRYDTQKAFQLSAILAAIETLCIAPFTIALSGLVYMGAFNTLAGSKVPAFTILAVMLGGLAGMIVLEIFAAFPFSQAFYLYIDHQEYTTAECLSKSRALMTGQIMNFVKLHLSLAGYFALCILSLGLGLVWVIPYLNVVRANFYMNLTGLYKPY